MRWRFVFPTSCHIRIYLIDRGTPQNYTLSLLERLSKILVSVLRPPELVCSRSLIGLSMLSWRLFGACNRFYFV